MKLRPCPFCGDQPKLIVGSDRLTKIVCPSGSSCDGSKLLICYCSEDEKIALECWNKRAVEVLDE